MEEGVPSLLVCLLPNFFSFFGLEMHMSTCWGVLSESPRYWTLAFSQLKFKPSVQINDDRPNDHTMMPMIPKLSVSSILCCSSSVGDWPTPSRGGVLWPDHSVSVSSSGSRCVEWSQRCDTLITWTYAAAAQDTQRCHSDVQKQSPMSASTEAHCGCCGGRSLGPMSALHRVVLTSPMALKRNH